MPAKPEEDVAEARNRIHDLLQELRENIGPFMFVQENSPCALSEWVLVMGWTDLEDGGNFTTITGSKGLLRTHRNGLLHEALYNYGDEEDD